MFSRKNIVLILIPIIVGIIASFLFNYSQRETITPSINNNRILLEESRKESSSVSIRDRFEEMFNLKRGKAIHSIPENFKVNIPQSIEASIVPQIIDKDKLFRQLNIKGTPTIVEDDIFYSSSGVDIKLKLDEEQFKVREINTGVKPIISEIPELWTWDITPLKKGNANITLLIEIRLVPKDNSKEIIKNFLIFNEYRTVKGNFSYSVSKFISNSWKEIATLLFGSGTFAGFIKWYFERRDAREARNQPEPEPEPMRLIDKLKNLFSFRSK